jgi:uncharacterized protein (DUF2147 family)
MRNALPALTLFALTAAAQQRTPAPIEGYWKNPIGSAVIAIAPCSKQFCGKVVWASARGQREVSKHAPSIVGTTVLTNVQYRNGRWSGSLYIPDDDINVSAHLQPAANGQMKLTGCAIMGLFCRTQMWTRVEQLPRGD